MTMPQHYSHLSDNSGGWNKRGGWDFLKKLVHKCNKRGVEGGKKSKKSINVEGGNVRGGWISFSKSVSVTSRLLEMRVLIRPTYN